MSDYLIYVNTEALEAAKEELSSLSEKLKILHESSFIKFSVDIASIGSLISDAISLGLTIKNSRKTVEDEFNKIIKKIGSSDKDISKAFSNIAKAMSGELSEPLKKEISNMKKELSGMGKTLENIAKSLGENIGKGLVKGIKGSKLDIDIATYDAFGKKGFGRVWEGIKGIFSGVGDFFSGIWSQGGCNE